MIKNRKGITLIALVITIIVMIMLAGITLGSLYDRNNILNQAQEASSEAQRESIITKIEADLLDEETKTGQTPTIDTLKEIIIDNNYCEGQPGENSFVTKDGNYTIKYSEIIGWK